jgi:hypothetical protein
MGAEASAVNVTATGVVVATPASLRGCSIRDTSGATNTVKIFDNASAASGTILLSVQLAANASIPPLAIDDGLRAANGLFLSATGAVEGSVWIG